MARKRKTSEPTSVVLDNVMVFNPGGGLSYSIDANGRWTVDYDGQSHEIFRVNPPTEDGSRIVYILTDTPTGRLPQAVGVLPPSAPEYPWQSNEAACASTSIDQGVTAEPPPVLNDADGVVIGNSDGGTTDIIAEGSGTVDGAPNVSVETSAEKVAKILARVRAAIPAGHTETVSASTATDGEGALGSSGDRTKADDTAASDITANAGEHESETADTGATASVETTEEKGAEFVARIKAKHPEIEVKSKLRSLLKQIRAACIIDGETVSEAVETVKTLREELMSGYSSTGEAGKAILSAVILLKRLPEDDIRDFVETLSAVNAKGEVRMLKLNARAEANLAIPLALDGYRDDVSGGHISRVSTVVGYAHELGVEPDDFPDFLDGEHSHRTGEGYGLKHAYQAAREFFAAGIETAEEKAARLRVKVLDHLASQPSMGTVNGAVNVTVSSHGLFCLVGRTSADGTIEVVSPVRNEQGKLIDRLLDILADQLELKAKKASSKTKAKKKGISFSDLAVLSEGASPH